MSESRSRFGDSTVFCVGWWYMRCSAILVTGDALGGDQGICYVLRNNNMDGRTQDNTFNIETPSGIVSQLCSRCEGGNRGVLPSYLTVVRYTLHSEGK